MKPATCPVVWPLADPNDEDRRNRNVHRCIIEFPHEGNHRCACGATYDFPPYHW